MRRTALLIVLASLIPIFSIRAAGEVDILWQGETYAPPFYEGRSLWSNESRVTLTAVSNLTSIAPSNLYYRWSKDGTVLGSLSGVNRRSITFTDSVLSRPIEVKVDIRDGENGPILGSHSVVLRPTVTRPIVVEDNPLYGLMFNKAVGGSFTLSEEEVTFAAIPLFARVTFRSAPTLTYTWTTNNGDSRTGNEVTYRVPEGVEGSSSVRLRITNSDVLQPIPEKSFLVQFDNQNGF